MGTKSPTFALETVVWDVVEGSPPILVLSGSLSNFSTLSYDYDLGTPNKYTLFNETKQLIDANKQLLYANI